MNAIVDNFFSPASTCATYVATAADFCSLKTYSYPSWFCFNFAPPFLRNFFYLITFKLKYLLFLVEASSKTKKILFQMKKDDKLVLSSP